MGGVLIHACAKIATDSGGAVSVADVVLIHACARIATSRILRHAAAYRFDSCMREDCNLAL